MATSDIDCEASRNALNYVKIPVCGCDTMRTLIKIWVYMCVSSLVDPTNKRSHRSAVL
jgi:hypothetical protein